MNMACHRKAAQTRAIASPVAVARSHPVHLGGTRPLGSWREATRGANLQVERPVEAMDIAAGIDAHNKTRNTLAVPSQSFSTITNHAPGNNHSIPPPRSHPVFYFQGPSRGHSIVWGDAEALRKGSHTRPLAKSRRTIGPNMTQTTATSRNDTQLAHCSRCRCAIGQTPA